MTTSMPPGNTLNIRAFHQVLHGATGDVAALPAQGLPGLASALAAPAGIEHMFDGDLVLNIALHPL